jgi:hypothetical protein
MELVRTRMGQFWKGSKQSKPAGEDGWKMLSVRQNWFWRWRKIERESPTEWGFSFTSATIGQPANSNFRLKFSPVARHSTVIIKQDEMETRGLRDTCSSQDILYFHDLYVASEVEETREAKIMKSQLDGLLEK